MLVERIAEAPEVRVALASQGVGLISDLGRQISRAASAVDDFLERTLRRLFRRRPRAAADRPRRARRAGRRPGGRRRDPGGRLRALHGDALGRPAADHRREDPGLAGGPALARRLRHRRRSTSSGSGPSRARPRACASSASSSSTTERRRDRRQASVPAPLGDGPGGAAVRPRAAPDRRSATTAADSRTASRGPTWSSGRTASWRRGRRISSATLRAEAAGARRYPSGHGKRHSQRALAPAPGRPARLLRRRRPRRADGRARARAARSARLRPQGDRPQQARRRAAQRARRDLRRGGDRGPRGRSRRLQRPWRLARRPRELREAAAAHDRRHLPARHEGPRRGPQVRRARATRSS